MQFKNHRSDKVHDAAANAKPDQPSQEQLRGVQGVTIFEDKRPAAQPLNEYALQGALGNQDGGVKKSIASSSQELIAKHAQEFKMERMYVDIFLAVPPSKMRF